MTYCPKCKYPQYCGCCESCKKKIPEGIKPVIPTKDGEALICPNCGFIGSYDYWLDEEVRQLEEEGIHVFLKDKCFRPGASP